MTTRLPRVKFSRYTLLDGTERTMLKQVGDGSIIRRFDKTPFPTKHTDIVCPHFLELKWAARALERNGFLILFLNS